MNGNKEKKEEEKIGIYMAYGMSFGIVFGAALIGVFGFISVGFGILSGMIIGNLIYMIKRKNN